MTPNPYIAVLSLINSLIERQDGERERVLAHGCVSCHRFGDLAKLNADRAN
ncbi:MAG: hypothetical protein ICV63_21930 [Coleofasciculus sp. Co-bin14]|nr:hypothetical protein [Coleofasciculus sp. Co-bin14]